MSNYFPMSGSLNLGTTTVPAELQFWYDAPTFPISGSMLDLASGVAQLPFELYTWPIETGSILAVSPKLIDIEYLLGNCYSVPLVYLDDDAANDVLTQFQSTFPAGSIIDIYDADNPADPNDAHTGNILVSITLPASPWGTPALGTMAKQNTWSGTAGNTGIPISARLRNAADTKRCDFTCTELGGTGQVTISTATITTGFTVSVTTLTITA